MSYKTLYRKYRPDEFNTVLGQEHITDVLEESIKSGNITHSYLFFGSRGTGKTTVARILANKVGCSPEDLYEMDGASNRGIDDIRELRESVRTLPFKSPYKVYIIDEVHMLTKEAFNALLKTLEEPPEYVIFILATTEVDKVPDTVVSRCQTFTFKKPTQALLEKSTSYIAKKEGYTLDRDATELISLLGDGSFRDMQVVLQKVLSSVKGKKVTVSDVERVTSVPGGEVVNTIISSISDENIESGLSAVGKAVEKSVDFKIFMKLILKKLRAILLMRFAPELTETLMDEFSPEDMKFLKETAKKSKNINSKVLLEMLEAYTATERAYLPQLPLELALIKIMNHDKEEKKE